MRIFLLAAFAALALVACSSDGGGSGGTGDGGTDTSDPVSPPILALHGETAPLTDLSLEAIGIAPAWLRHDLGLSLRLQDADRADELAALLVDIEDPRLIDEVAFTIAHISPQVLASPGFFPQLLVENAQGVYDRDPELDYVELIDEGDPEVDDDFWTTAVYRFSSKGVEQEREVDREIYYWFVVHPKLEDENPWYVDAWDPCSADGLECAATPDDGWHWRDFLWDKADDTCPEEGLCPVLADWMPGIDLVWDGMPNGGATGALYEIVSFMHHSPADDYRWLVFGAYGERSIQPNRIYGLGRGNCGEWADMTSALARTALIPNVNSTPASWDHTWNAFFNGSTWVEWEPVNWWIDHAYNAPFSNYATRGDGFVMLQTEDYTDDTFTMEVEVYDSAEAPVAGASVAVYTPWEYNDTLYWTYAGEAPTDADGVARFPLVAMQEYAVRVETPVGSWPEEENKITYASQSVEAGQIDVQAYNLAVPLPDPPAVTEVGFDGETDATLVVELADASARISAVSQRYGTTYTVEGAAPDLDAFLVDADNLVALEAGEEFEAAWAGNAVDAEIPFVTSEPWYLVIANDHEIATAALGEIGLEVLPEGGIEFTGDSALEVSFEIPPLGHAVFSVSPAE